MNCPMCYHDMSAFVDITGGCECDSSEDYCYCDSKDVHVELTCSNTKCLYHRSPLRPGKLGDRYAIARFIDKHYTGE